MQKSVLIRTLREQLGREATVEFAYLFGSRATETDHADSDADIALFLKEDRPEEVLRLIAVLSKVSGLEADVTVLNRTRNLFLLDTVFRDGIVVKDSPEREAFELAKEHEILDYKAFRRMMDAA